MAHCNNADQKNGQVIEMDRFRSGTSLSPLRQIEAYWTALRDEGNIPTRSQIDPRGLEQMLKYAFILERIAPGVARFRIAGHHLTDHIGMEVRGMPFTALFDGESRNRIGDIIEHVFDVPAIVELQLQGRNLPVEARVILLPLRSETGEVSRIIGAFVCDGPVAGQDNTFFSLESLNERSVNGEPAPIHAAPVQAPDPVATDDAEELRGFAEDAPSFTPKRGHLRLIKSDT